MASLQLDPLTVAAFREKGYVGIRSVMTEEEIASLRRAFDCAFRSQAAHDDGMIIDYAETAGGGSGQAVAQVLEPLAYAPALRESPFNARAESIANQLLGCEVVYRGSHALRKGPFCPQDTPWHQDEAYWNPALVHDAVSVWLPLQDATLDNGCMQFMPGSHTADVLPHHHIRGDSKVHGLEVDALDTSRADAVPIPLGSVVVHHCRTLHYGGPNRTSHDRAVVVLVFGRQPVARSVPRTFPWQELTSEAARTRRAAGKSHY